jgi:hypothetical protein
VGESEFTVVAGDASNRRYFRLGLPGSSYIVVDAPPATEKNEAFLGVRELLEGAGVHVPALYASDLERGYLLLEDLGDRPLLAELGNASVDGHYRRAFGVLQRMAAVNAEAVDLPAYDSSLLQEELSRCPEWFVEGLLAYELEDGERDLFDRLAGRLVHSALEQPRVLVHRDFHSRNLMLQADDRLAVIDFQDAVIGPVTYDPASLLRDCYIRWPASRVTEWSLLYRDELIRAGLLEPVSDVCFTRWFDWMGLQRHIKVLGTFARLHLRDGKPGYLEDLTLVIAYVREILQKYAREEPDFGLFEAWFDSVLGPLVQARAWGMKS